jgi:hypothetical protein
MRADKARVEGEFRKQRALALLHDLRRGWLVLLLSALLVAWFAYWAFTPRRDLGFQSAEVLGIGVRESKTGSYPSMDVRLDDGATINVPISRGDVVQRGARVQLRVTAHGRQRSYRYVQTLAHGPSSNE